MVHFINLMTQYPWNIDKDTDNNNWHQHLKHFSKIKRKLKLIVTVVEDGSKESVGQTSQKDHGRQDISLWKSYDISKINSVSSRSELVTSFRGHIKLLNHKDWVLKDICRLLNDTWKSMLIKYWHEQTTIYLISMYLASEKLTGQLEDLFWAKSNLWAFLLHLAAYFLILGLFPNLAGDDLGWKFHCFNM